MNPKFADDRLSAFVDGTLSPTETAELRLEIERSPELAALVAELRQVRTELQALPRVKASEGFAARVMDKIAAAQREAAVVTPAAQPAAEVRPAAASRSNWSSFALGAIAASVALLLLTYFIPRHTTDVANNTPNQLLQSPDTINGNRAFDTVNLGNALAKAADSGDMFIARLTVRNSALLQGSLEETLVKKEVTVATADGSDGAIKTAAEAYRQAVGADEPRAIREVLYLVGTDSQVREALDALTGQPMDVANLQDKVVAVPADKLVAAGSEVARAEKASVVRVAQKQIFKSLGREIADGEGELDANASSDVLVVIRIVK